MKNSIDILIPTYNRKKWLKKNIELINKLRLDLKVQDRINVIISNNCSTDGTEELLCSIKYKNYYIFNQNRNIGLEKNALFCLSKATSEFVMFLGDDDYLNIDYLELVLKHIDENDNLSLIVPSCQSIDAEGDEISGGRDLDVENNSFKASIDSAVYFSTRGCQMSGVLHRKGKLLDSYLKDKVSNIYPFVYFTTYSSLTGESIHLTKNPVLITQPGQENKTWNYGDDGLLDEIFNNFKCLSLIGKKERFLLEREILNTHRWRWIVALKEKPLRLIISIISSKNSLLMTKLSFPFLILKYSTSKVIKYVFRK